MNVFSINIRPARYRHFQIHFQNYNNISNMTICDAYQTNRIKLPNIIIDELKAFFRGFSSAIICVDYLVQNEINISYQKSGKVLNQQYIEPKYTLIQDGNDEIVNTRKCLSFSSDRRCERTKDVCTSLHSTYERKRIARRIVIIQDCIMLNGRDLRFESNINRLRIFYNFVDSLIGDSSCGDDDVNSNSYSSNELMLSLHDMSFDEILKRLFTLRVLKPSSDSSRSCFVVRHEYTITTSNVETITAFLSLIDFERWVVLLRTMRNTTITDDIRLSLCIQSTVKHTCRFVVFGGWMNSRNVLKRLLLGCLMFKSRTTVEPQN